MEGYLLVEVVVHQVHECETVMHDKTERVPVINRRASGGRAVGQVEHALQQRHCIVIVAAHTENGVRHLNETCRTRGLTSADCRALDSVASHCDVAQHL